MEQIKNVLMAELLSIIPALGKDGGLMSPSVYDTAQILRLLPPPEGKQWDVVDWLLSQQNLEDGGWGDPAMPLHRDIPTLAAVLALCSNNNARRYATQEAIRRGVTFVRRQAAVWSKTDMKVRDDLPVGGELVLPGLLDQLDEEWKKPDSQLSRILKKQPSEAEPQLIPRKPYGWLIEFGNRKRKVIAQLPCLPGMPWHHCREIIGGPIDDKNIFDRSGGISHSPAATASWVNEVSVMDPNGPPETFFRKLKPEYSELRGLFTGACRYLKNAENACGMGINGVTSSIYPFQRYEQLFSLYALQIADLLKDSEIRDRHVLPFVKELAYGIPASDEIAMSDDILLLSHDGRTMRGTKLASDGIAMTDYFLKDGDNTAAAVLLLHEFSDELDDEVAGRQKLMSILSHFHNDNHFVAYGKEMHPSPTVTARCIHALMEMGEDVTPYQKFLLDRQEPDGRWTVDKWNRSWLYTTGHAVIALMDSPHEVAVREAIDAVLVSQHEDGGWSTHGQSNMTETAYAVLMLAYLERKSEPFKNHKGINSALDRAFRWMLDNYRPFVRPEIKVKCWIAKELYRVDRIDTIFELSALLMLDQRKSKERVA